MMCASMMSLRIGSSVLSMLLIQPVPALKQREEKSRPLINWPRPTPLAKLLYFCKAAEGLASDSGISVEHLVYLGHTLALTFVIRDANSKKPEEDVVAPGLPRSHTRPYVRHKGRKFEKARGRR